MEVNFKAKINFEANTVNLDENSNKPFHNLE